MIAGGKGNDPAGLLGSRQPGYGVEGAAEFEGPDALEIFAFEKYCRSHPLVEGSGGHDRREVDVAPQTFGGLMDLGKHTGPFRFFGLGCRIGAGLPDSSGIQRRTRPHPA
jgi:hypothetical protein